MDELSGKDWNLDSNNYTNAEIRKLKKMKISTDRNFPLEGAVKEAIKQLFDTDKKLLNKILTKIIGRHRRSVEGLTSILEGIFTFQDMEGSAGRILLSAIIEYKKEKGKSNVQELNSLSQQNLERIRADLENIRKRIEKRDGERVLIELESTIGRLTQLLEESHYNNPVVTHASKNTIAGQINSTSIRERIARFVGAVTKIQGTPKVSNTGEMNTKKFDSHDLVFFNIYPDVKNDFLREILKRTRFIREKYALAGSPISENAHTYIYRLNDLLKRYYGGGDTPEAILVMTFRDPVYPAGGNDEAANKRRIEREGTQYLRSSSGTFDFRLDGQGKKKEDAERYSYETKENIFTGLDIQKALILNVERGLYRMLLHLDKEGRVTLLEKINDILEMKKGAGQDEAILNIIKLFQYPQLMLSGSIPIEDNERIINWRGGRGEPEDIINERREREGVAKESASDESKGGSE